MARRLVLLIASILLALQTVAVAVDAAAMRPPVVAAAQRGDADAVRTLLQNGADVNQAQGDGMTALHWAAQRGDARIAEMLLYAGANTAAGTRIGSYTALHMASKEGHADVVRALLAAHADANARTTTTGVVPLHLAAASPSAETLELLLAADTDVDVTERAWGQTPLMFAAGANRLENVRLLLDAGADVAATAAVVDTVAREKADKAAEKRIVQVLAEFKAKAGGDAGWLPRPDEVQGAIDFSRDIQRNWPNVPDPECDPPQPAEQRQAAAQGAGEAQPAEEEKQEDSRPAHCFDAATAAAGGADARGGGNEAATDADADDVDKEEAGSRSYGQLVGEWGGLTPLLHAVRQGYTEVALALLDAGADINQRSAGDGTTPLLMAAVNGQFDLLPLLLEHGADPNLASEAGTTPLFAVLERQWAPWAHYAHPIDYRRQKMTHLEAMQALLDAGADPNVRLEKHLWYAEFTTSVLVPAGLQYDGATPFWRAAQALDVDAMRLLREHGADPMIPTRKIPERRRGQRDPMPEAQEEKADPTGLPPVPVGGPYVYPLHAAAGAGYGQYFMAHAHRHVPDNWLAAVRYLVEECGYDVNMRDANGYTPLHHAAARGDNELIEYLLGKGADVMAVSRKGQTTADMANGPTQRVAPFPDTIKLLTGLGAVNNHNCVSC